MKHAKNLFAEALKEALEIGEKARKQRERKERRASDRETIRVKRKRARVNLTEREKVQLTFNL
jgi:hypothetical protein